MHIIGRTLATVKFGVHKTHDTCRASLRTNGIKVSPWGEDLLNQIPLSQTPTDIDLIEFSVAELGFDTGSRYDRICDRIKERDFDRCPAEAAVMLRESYKNQPMKETLIVAMEALTDVAERPLLFGIAHDEVGLWLYTRYGYPDYLYHPKDRFVVARRKQT